MESKTKKKSNLCWKYHRKGDIFAKTYDEIRLGKQKEV